MASPQGGAPFFFLDAPPLRRAAYRHMSLAPDPPSPQHPPAYAIELAHALADSVCEREMMYEEYTFEIEGGSDDGCEYKVLVMRI